MNQAPKKLWMRWLEVADVPAATAAMISAILLAFLVGSCNSPGPVATTPRPARTDQPAGAPPSGETEGGEPVLRVRIVESAEKLTLGGPASIKLEPENRPSAARNVNTPIVISRGAAGWLIRDGAGVAHAIGDLAVGGDPLVIRGSRDQTITIDDRPYPGDFTLRPRPISGGGAPRFDVIEAVPLETYLAGVLSKELLSKWSLTAYKAQAVAARSYALHERSRSRANGEVFDLESNQWDQMYGGAIEHGTASRAVRETRGLVLTTGGRTLRAYYSSTCGGRPAAARDVWPTTKGFEFNLDPPIQGTQGPEDACTFSSRFRWSVVRPRDELTKRLAAYGRDNGFAIRDLQSISRLEPSRTTGDGRPTAYKVFDASGKWFPLSAEELRTACNWTGSSGQPAVNSQTRVFSGDIELRLEGSTCRITGRGFGHGVGMCQYGAEGRARQGQTYEQILMHYYPGALIERIY